MAIYNAPVQGAMCCVEAKSGYTPAVNDLVVWDTGANWTVDGCADTEVPIGIVRQILDSTTMYVERFSSGAIVQLKYNTSDAAVLGNKVAAAGLTTVEDNSGGVGFVVSVDVPAVGDCVVAF